MPEIQITHDGTFDIAIGRSRKETNWKNREYLWSDLVKKLSVTHYTAETYAEYLSAKKPRQDEIKDIGGFVGGYLSGGRRKAGSVLHRQLVTLDIDFAHAGIWEDFTLMYNNAAVLYSTHKHSKEAPRLRLILPLDRPVFVDEYVAIARRIAGIIGIDTFDHTTFEPSRLMYWPSTSKDGDYLYEYQDGAWLSADEILATYHNWKDSSEWPVSERYQNIIRQAIKKQGDPLEKPGVVGAWCRNYTISEVIAAHLSDVYDPCDTEDRYTYVDGSTSGGLVVYDDKYAYSHHGTDPVSGKLCNAFDLVRLHKYGMKDEDVKEGTPGNKLPSYTAMVEFATKTPGVRKLLSSERIQEARDEFKTDEEIEEVTAEVVNDEWLSELDIDRKGNLLNGIDNVVMILENDPGLRKRIVFDEFEQREIAIANLPWRKIDESNRYLKDSDVANLKHFFKGKYKITVTTVTIEDALKVVFERNKVHAVRDYLNSLHWDGAERIDDLLVLYLGAEDNDYTRAVTRKTLVAAVARIYQPGIKFDNMLTLVGQQGIGKSTIINKLGGKWFSDSFNFHMLQKGKEASEQLQGAWLVEVGELAGLRKADVEGAKSFLSKREDRYRMAYGRRVDSYPRQCVFFGSTNNHTFLRDPSGNRRFWPVKTRVTTPAKSVFTDLSKEEIDQIWAEAVYLYEHKEPLYLSDEIKVMAEAVQEGYTEKDERIGLIQKYLDTLLPDNWDDMDIYARRGYLQGDELQVEGTNSRSKVCAAEIWHEVIKGRLEDMNNQNTKFIHDIMEKMPGWERAKGHLRFGKIYGSQRGYTSTKCNHTDIISGYGRIENVTMRNHKN